MRRILLSLAVVLSVGVLLCGVSYAAFSEPTQTFPNTVPLGVLGLEGIDVSQGVPASGGDDGHGHLLRGGALYSTAADNNLDLVFGGTRFNLRNYSGTLSSPLFVVDSDGKVGIGTTDPGATLDVNGTVKVGHFRGLTLSGATTQNATFGAWPGYDSANSWLYLSNGNTGSPAYADLAVGNLSVANALIGNYGLLPSYAAWNAYGTGAGGAAIYNDSGSYRTLMIVGNNSAGGNRRVGIWDDLSVSGSISNYGTPQYPNGMSTYVLNTNYLYPRDNSSDPIYIGLDGTSVIVRGSVTTPSLCLGADCRTSWPIFKFMESDPTVPTWAKASNPPAPSVQVWAGRTNMNCAWICQNTYGSDWGCAAACHWQNNTSPASCDTYRSCRVLQATYEYMICTCFR